MSGPPFWHQKSTLFSPKQYFLLHGSHIAFFRFFEIFRKIKRRKCDPLSKTYYFGDISRRRVSHFLSSFLPLVFCMPSGRPLLLLGPVLAPFSSLLVLLGALFRRNSIFRDPFPQNICRIPMTPQTRERFLCTQTSPTLARSGNLP